MDLEPNIAELDIDITDQVMERVSPVVWPWQRFVAAACFVFVASWLVSQYLPIVSQQEDRMKDLPSSVVKKLAPNPETEVEKYPYLVKLPTDIGGNVLVKNKEQEAKLQEFLNNYYRARLQKRENQRQNQYLLKKIPVHTANWEDL
jgi:hypothetical protein